MFIKFERFTFQAYWLKRKKNIFLGPTHNEKIILSRRLPRSMFHRFVYKIWEIYLFKHADLKLFFWAHPQRENYFVSWPTLVYEISQTFKFHRFVYEVWEIYLFKHANLKIFFLNPPTTRQNNFLVVGGAQTNIFFSLISARLKKQIFQTLWTNLWNNQVWDIS